MPNQETFETECWILTSCAAGLLAFRIFDAGGITTTAKGNSALLLIGSSALIAGGLAAIKDRGTWDFSGQASALSSGIAGLLCLILVNYSNLWSSGLVVPAVFVVPIVMAWLRRR